MRNVYIILSTCALVCSATSFGQNTTDRAAPNARTTKLKLPEKPRIIIPCAGIH